MDKKNEQPRVAVATGKTREETVRKAIDLVREELLANIIGSVMIKPNFLSSVNNLASTLAGAVRPVIELLRDADAESVIIAEGGSRSTPQAFDNFGYREMAKQFSAECVDLNHGHFSRSFEIITGNRTSHIAQYADLTGKVDTIISVPVAKTHDTAGVTLSLKNMMGCLRRVHRPRMHGIRIGGLPSLIGETLWNTIEGHPLVIKSFSGVIFSIVQRIRSRNTKKDDSVNTGFIKQVGAMAENLARLGEILMPDIAIIDAFEAMEGDGPGSAGTPVAMKVAVVGTDPIACDTVMASMMGFESSDIGYLTLAHERGLGVADIGKIEIVGEDPGQLRRYFKPHSNFPVQKKWREAWND